MGSLRGSVPDVHKSKMSSLKLANAVDDLSLAVMIMRKLKAIDELEYNRKLGYANMFQWILDFFGLARVSSAPQGSEVEFPMMPDKARTFDDSSRRTPLEIHNPAEYQVLAISSAWKRKLEN